MRVHEFQDTGIIIGHYSLKCCIWCGETRVRWEWVLEHLPVHEARCTWGRELGFWESIGYTIFGGKVNCMPEMEANRKLATEKKEVIFRDENTKYGNPKWWELQRYNKEVGRLWVGDDDKMHFSGNLDESARVLFDLLKSWWDKGDKADI